MFKRILVPLDGSQLAEAALPSALLLANRFDADLFLLRVTTPQQFIMHYDGSTYVALLDDLREQANAEALRYLQQQQQLLAEQGYKVQTLLLEETNIAETILQQVELEAIDVIVMSTHGHGGIRRWVFGSIADKILRQADVPVMLIRASEKILDWQLPEQPAMLSRS